MSAAFYSDKDINIGHSMFRTIMKKIFAYLMCRKHFFSSFLSAWKYNIKQ